MEPKVSKIPKIQRIRTRRKTVMPETIWNTLHGSLEGNDLLGSPHRPERESEKNLVESLKIKGFTCLDVGFNYGWWTWLFLKNIGREGKVYAWEPNKFLYENYRGQQFPANHTKQIKNNCHPHWQER